MRKPPIQPIEPITHYLTPTQYQKMFHVSKSTFWRWVRSGQVEVVRVGPRTIRVPVSRPNDAVRMEATP